MKSNYHFIFLLVILISGCSSEGYHAPVVDRGLDGKAGTSLQGSAGKNVNHEKDWRPESIIVKKGDTLYSIAFNYGFDYHELAELNDIKDPSVIAIGQQIRLFPGKSTPVNGVAETKEITAVTLTIKDQPKLVKYAYSDAALAKIENIQEPTKSVPSNSAKPTITKAEDKSNTEQVNIEAPDETQEGTIEWGMPAQGKLIGQFSESANRKGIDITGKLGQPVFASASGKVVYSGSGLRGYGKLIIIKHNKIYLSAYAHNDKVLVKEGQSVSRGQKIAEMGSTDSNRVELHFEVRRLGKPVDPAKYLPISKS